MSEQPIITEEVEETEGNPFELPELTHTVLEMWASLLGDAEQAYQAPLRPQEALGVIKTWPFLKIQDTGDYLNRYYTLLLDARDELMKEVLLHEGCFDHVKDDAEHNRDAYIGTISRWLLMLDQEEAEWEGYETDADVEAAAIMQARETLLSPMGLIAHLDVLGMEISEVEFADRLTELEESGE